LEGPVLVFTPAQIDIAGSMTSSSPHNISCAVAVGAEVEVAARINVSGSGRNGSCPSKSGGET
jgi:hypothetical protein